MEEIEITAVKLDTAPAETSLKSLRQELKALKDQMAGLEEGSDAFLECANKAGTLKHQIDEITQSVNGASADFGDMLGNVSKVATGIIGGFQAAQGALTLFGVESEEVTKAIQKMQASMAIVQGLNSIDQGIKALAKLRNSITATTSVAKLLRDVLTPKALLALTAAIGIAITLFKKFKSNVEDTYDSFKEINKETQNNVSKVSEQISKIELLKSTINNENKSLSDKKKALNELNRIIPEYNGNIDETTGKLVASTDAENKYIESLLNEAKAQAVIKQTEGLMEKRLQLQLQLEQKQNELSDAEAKALKATNDFYTHQGDVLYAAKLDKANLKVRGIKNEITELNNDILNTEKDIKDISTAASSLITVENLVEKENTKVVKENTKVVKEAKEVKDTFYDDAYAEIEYNKAINEEYANSKTALEDLLYVQEQELATLEEGSAAWYKLATNIEQTKQNIEDFGKTDEEAVTTETTQPEEKDPIALELYSVQDALADLATSDSWGIVMKNMGNLAVKMADVGKQIKQNGKQDWTAYAQIAAYALSMVGTSLTQLASQEDATDKEGFERKKKLEISGAVMNMLGGIVGAVSSAMNPANAWMTAPGQIAMASVMSALIAGVGTAQIASIAKQQMGSTDSGSSSSALTSSSSINNAIIAPVQYTSDVQGASIESAIKDTKVYVTETDLQRVHNKVSVAETESRY